MVIKLFIKPLKNENEGHNFHVAQKSHTAQKNNATVSLENPCTNHWNSDTTLSSSKKFSHIMLIGMH